VVKLGEVDEVAQDFAAGLKQPLTVSIRPASDPVEVAKIGLWLQQRRPVLQVRGDCVGSCAKSILLSGDTLTITPGSVIAFGGMAEVGMRMKEQIDAGDIFSDEERSQASRDHFLKVFKPWIDRGFAVREQHARQAAVPDAVLRFIDAATGGWRVDRVSFSGEDFSFNLKPVRHGCMWWVPDAVGLKQLGLDVPGYRPARLADAAKLLDVPQHLIYIGPTLEVLPEQPLCTVPPGSTTFNIHALP